MDNGDEGTIELRYVTYLLSYTSANPGVEVHYTCSAAPAVPEIQADQKSLHLDDYNVAHALGITIEVESRYDSGTWNSAASSPPGARWGKATGEIRDPYVDTLLVRLHVRKAYETAVARDSLDLKYLDAAVLTTIDCIRDNATRSDIPIRHVRLIVDGPAHYRRLGGMFPIRSRSNRGPRHPY